MTENTPNSTDESADNQPDIETLAERVNQLEERQQELRQGAVDAQGRNWTLSDLLNLGLTRRQALSAIAALAGGATIGTAMMQAVSPASAAPGDSGNTVLGASDNRWDAWMGEVSIDSLSITPIVDKTVTLSAGGVTFVEVGASGDFGKPYFATVVPATSDDEFKPKLARWRNRSTSSFGVVIEETGGSSGGDARVIVHKIGV